MASDGCQSVKVDRAEAIQLLHSGSGTDAQMKEGAPLMTEASPNKFQGIKSKIQNLLAQEGHGRSTGSTEST